MAHRLISWSWRTALTAGVVVTAASVVAVDGARPAPMLCNPRVEMLSMPNLRGVMVNGVAVSPGGIVWAVGVKEPAGPDKADETVILRWNGRRFVRVPAPSLGPRYERELRRVVAPADNAAWAVGIAGILRWDGRRWLRTSAPRGSYFGVGADGRNDVWAVGVDRGLLVSHWDGRRWRRVPFSLVDAESAFEGPDLSGVAWTYLNGVLPLGSDDVWIAGNTPTEPFTAHWDGSTWTLYGVPDAWDESLGSLVEAGPDHLWAAGNNNGGGLIAEWEGQGWAARGRFEYASDIVLRRSEVWAAVEYASPTGLSSGAVVRWNGSGWTRLEPTQRDLRLNDLAVDGRGDVWAGGSKWVAEGTPADPFVRRYRCSR